MTTSPSRTAAIPTGALIDEIPALRNLDPADPYSAYRAIFGEPLVVAGGDVVILTRYADCNEILRHPDVTMRRSAATAFRGLQSSFLHNLDPPEHTRIRRVANKAFSPRSVEQLRPWLEDQVHALLDAAPAAPFDVIAGLAYPLPLNAICEMFGLPVEDRPKITTWSRCISKNFDFLAGRRSRDEQLLLRSAFLDFRRYLRDAVEQRRQSPGDDLLSRLMRADDTGDRLSEKDIVWTALGLLVTGHETTVSTVGHGAVALVDHPEWRDSVARDDAFADSFVEEVLRYDSPVQTTLRVAARDLSIGGVDVHAGAVILVLLGAANRDPDQFRDPDTFDVHRANNRTHLAFGGGPHYCVGATLGRLETRIAMVALATRLLNPRGRPGGVHYDTGILTRTQTRVEIDIDALLPRPRAAVQN
jgi:cytochrome P450